jgi:dTDP-4-amino-4,6-dideoxygalactose transaminase
LGYNFRMTDVHAAIGLAQLGKLERFNSARQANARLLSEKLCGVIVPAVPQGSLHVFHQYTVRVPEAPAGGRDALRAHLQEHGVGSEVYYPVPVHKQSLYTHDLGYDQTLPAAEQAAAEVLSLPVHPALSAADLEMIVGAVNGFYGRAL